MEHTNQAAPSSAMVSDELRRKLYDDDRRQIWQDIQSGTDNFDRHLLAISGAALGVSLTFVKDFLLQKGVIWPTLLYVSWITFGLCVVLTIFSFRLSVSALRKQLEFIEEFYLNKKEKYRDMESIYSKALKVFTWAAAVLFLVGLLSTVVFCIENFKQEVSVIEPKKVADLKGGRAFVTDGRPTLPMASIVGGVEHAVIPPEGIAQKGRPPISMAPVQMPVAAPSIAPVATPNSTSTNQTPAMPTAPKQD